jgi:hypothetical protein
MCQRREVAAGPDGAPARHPRENTSPQTFEEQLRDLYTRPGDTGRQAICPEHERRPDDLVRIRIAHTAGMAAQEPDLELVDELSRDRLRDQPTEPGVDAVGAFRGGGGALHDLARGAHPLSCRLRQLGPRTVDRDGPDMVDLEVVAGEDLGLDHGRTLVLQ